MNAPLQRLRKAVRMSWQTGGAVALVCTAALAGCGGDEVRPATPAAGSDAPKPSGRAVELRTTFRAAGGFVFVRVPIPVGWTSPSGTRSVPPPLVALRRDAEPVECGQIVAIFVVRPDQLREFESRLRGPQRDVAVPLRAGGRTSTITATVRHSGSIFDRVPDGRIIGDGRAVGIAEIRDEALPPIRIVASGFGGGGGCPGGAPRAGAEIDAALRTVSAGLQLRVARRGRGYAIVTSSDR